MQTERCFPHLLEFRIGGGFFRVAAAARGCGASAFEDHIAVIRLVAYGPVPIPVEKKVAYSPESHRRINPGGPAGPPGPGGIRREEEAERGEGRPSQSVEGEFGSRDSGAGAAGDRSHPARRGRRGAGSGAQPAGAGAGRLPARPEVSLPDPAGGDRATRGAPGAAGGPGGGGRGVAQSALAPLSPQLPGGGAGGGGHVPGGGQHATDPRSVAAPAERSAPVKKRRVAAGEPPGGKL